MYLEEKWWKFKQGISNLYYYFKVIWKDQNFDYSFIDSLLLAKLKRTKDYLDKNIYYSMDKKVIQSLKICIDILERKEKDFYYKTFENLINNPMPFEEIFIKDKNNKNYLLNPKWTVSLNMPYYNELKEKAESIEKRDNILFNNIYLKYKEEWWS
jgi:hypothetical protein